MKIEKRKMASASAEGRRDWVVSKRAMLLKQKAMIKQ